MQVALLTRQRHQVRPPGIALGTRGLGARHTIADVPGVHCINSVNASIGTTFTKLNQENFHNFHIVRAHTSFRQTGVLMGAFQSVAKSML